MKLNLTKNINQAKADGLDVKNKGDDRGSFVTIKRKVRRKDGNMNKQPEVVDAAKRNIASTMIGNGSEVNVLYSTYEWEFKGRSGVSADLRAVQVTNLIPYNVDADADEAFEVVPDGFVGVTLVNVFPFIKLPLDKAPAGITN